MKKPDVNPVDQVEVDQEAAQLVRLNVLVLKLSVVFDLQLGNSADDEENRRKEEEAKLLQKLFAKCKFFVSREVPREMFAFAIRQYLFQTR